jgi:uncharacterized protein (TIRG00374 family)
VLALLGRGSAELETRVPRFRRDTVGVIRHRWPGWIGGIFVSHLSLYLVLLLSLRAVGVESHQVDALRVLVAFAITRLLTAIPVTPGGIGIAEASYIALLSAGLDDQETVNLVTAGVLVFRALTYLLPIPLGGLSWLYWTVDERWRRPPGSVDARLGA